MTTFSCRISRSEFTGCWFAARTVIGADRAVATRAEENNIRTPQIPRSECKELFRKRSSRRSTARRPRALHGAWCQGIRKDLLLVDADIDIGQHSNNLHLHDVSDIDEAMLVDINAGSLDSGSVNIPGSNVLLGTVGVASAVQVRFTSRRGLATPAVGMDVEQDGPPTSQPAPRRATS